MSDNMYKNVKLKYGIVRMRLVNRRYQILYIDEIAKQNGTIAEGFISNQDLSQPIPKITPWKEEAKHQTNFELTNPEMPKLRRQPKTKPGTSSRKERNVPEVPSKSKTLKKKQGNKSQLPHVEMPKLQREPKIKSERAPENYKCQAMGKKLVGPELKQFQRTAKKDRKMPVIATSKAIKKRNNKNRKMGADSKENTVQPKPLMPKEDHRVDALIKYMRDAMKIGCQTPKPKETDIIMNVTD